MRSALGKTDLPAAESFYFLNGLNYLGEVRKSDLINYLFAETTTGMEAINKLIKAKLIKERISPADKRAKLIQLTPQGIQSLNKAYKLAGKAAEITLHQVPDSALIQCFELLKDCEAYQSKIAIDLKSEAFEAIYQAVTGD
jgi:DNA-binding MarR family transcriptional regulator